jgi:hypothetical protein
MADKPYACYDTRTLRYLRTQDAGVIIGQLVMVHAGSQTPLGNQHGP